MNIPHPIDLILEQAVDAYKQGDLESAQTHFLNILNIDSRHPDAVYFMAMIDINAGRSEVAEYRAKELLVQKPDDGKAHNLLATILMNQGKTAEAIPLFRKGIQHEPHNPVLKVNAAICYIGEGDPDQAITLCKEAITLKRDYINAYNILGNAFMGNSDMKNAAIAFEYALRLMPDFHDVRFNLGVALAEMRRYEEAEARFDEILTANPQNTHALCRKADILMIRKNIGHAGRLYEKAANIDKTFVPAYIGRGKVFHAVKKYDEALSNFRRAIELNPTNTDALMMTGDSFRKLGNKEAAAAAFKDILSLDPKNSQAKFHLAAVLDAPAPARPDSDYIKHLFDEFADSFDTSLSDIDYDAPEQLATLAEQHLPENRRVNLDIIDIGCGTGLNGIRFKPLARTLKGIDISPRMLSLASKRGIYDQLEENDILTAMVRHQDDYDIAVSADTFPYIGDLESIFISITSAIRDGGLFLFTVEKHESGEDFKLNSTARYSHSRTYIEDLAQRRGLEMLTCKDTTYRKEAGRGVDGMMIALRKSYA